MLSATDVSELSVSCELDKLILRARILVMLYDDHYPVNTFDVRVSNFREDVLNCKTMTNIIRINQ